MPEYTWDHDAPSGVAKNRYLSDEIRMAAIANTKFLPLCGQESAYGRGKGDTVNIERVPNIAEPSEPRFTEDDEVPVDTFAMNSTSVTVKYFGRGVRFSEKTTLLANYDPEDKIQKKLREQMRLSMDTAAAVAFKAGKVSYIPTSPTGGVFDTDGTPSTTALANVSVQHLKIIRDYMMDTLLVPGANGGDEFIGCLSTKACRGIRNDPEFLAWSQYSRPGEAFMKGEIGMVENIRIIEINHTQALSNAKGSSSVLGEGVIFGDEAVTMAVAMDPELRAAIPANFGLKRAVAWIGLLEFLNVWGDSASAGEARTVTITSA